MKPRNPIYVGSPPIDPPDESVMIQCTHCLVRWYTAEWRNNNGRCPGCCKPYAGKHQED